MAAVARHAAETEPTPPMRYAPRLPMDIQTIVLRCLAKDPQRRYANASALAEDIEAYLNGNPISARRDSTMYVLRKLVLRNRAASAAIALVAMPVLLAAVGFALLAAGLDQARREGERALSDSTVQRARLMAEGGDGEQAEALLWGEALRAGMTDHEGLYSGGTDAQLRSAWSLMEFYTRLPRVMRADMPEQGTTVGFSADSSSVWAIDTLGSRRTWSLDGRLLACEPGPPLQRGAGVGRVSYGSANGRYVVFESDGKAATWDIDRGRVLGGEIRSSTNLLYSYIDDHGTTLLSIHEPKQGRIRICDMRMGSVVAEFDDAGWYYSLQHDLDGLPVVLIGTRSSSGRRVLVRRPPDWQAEVVVTLDDDAHGDPVQGVRCPTLSPDGTRLAFAVSSTVMVYDISGDPFLVAKRHMMAREIERIAFHVSGQSLTVADRDGLLMNLALPDLDRTCTFATNRKTSALALSPTSDLVVVAPQGSGIAVYEPANTPWLERVASTPMTHTSIACAADGTLAWGDDAGTLHVRSPLAPHSITSIPLAHKGVITSVAFSPDGRKIVTAGFDGRVIVRGLDGSSVLTLVDGPNRVWCARYSPDGRTIAAGFQDGTIHVWTLDRSDEARVLSFGSSRIPMIEFGPDGRSLLCAAVSPQSEAVLLDMETGRPIHRLAGHGSNFVRAATWSLDGSIVVTSSDDRTLRVWDALSGRLVRIIPGLPWGPYDLAFHPQGRVLFAVGPGGSIIVVDPHAGTELAQLAVHDRSIFSIAVSPDGTKLITSGEDSWIGIADLDHLRSYIRGNEGYWRSAGSDTPPLE